MFETDRVPSGKYLRPDESIYSSNGKYNAALRRDGDFVVYDNERDRTLWSSRTAGQTSVASLVVQEDANMVLYRKGGEPYWSSDSWQKASSGIELIMQDDGNLVLYGDGGNPIWASDTWQG